MGQETDEDLRRTRTSSSEDQTGSFATLLQQGRGTLVYVTALDYQLDESRLASSLLKDKSLVFPDEHGAHCWHAVHVYMRSRLKAPESVCERWGSLMHSLWDSVAGWQPRSMVSRLFMRQSPVLDQPAVYELFVREVTKQLYHCGGMNPYRMDRYSWEGYAEDEEYDAADAELVRTSLRENVDSTEWWRQPACPVGLLESAQDAVSSALNLRSRRGALAGLPLHRADAVAAVPSAMGW